MSFVYPAFLWALGLLAIPIIIHLFNFRRFKTVYFSNVKFLKQIDERTSTRNRLKHLLVLIARLLAMAFLVFAFARPYIPLTDSQPDTRTRAVSIYLDNSFSMNALASERSLLEEGRAMAAEIASAYSPDDRFQLLTNDFEGRHQRLLSKEEFLQYLSEVRVSSAVRSLQQVLERQKNALSQDPSAEAVYFLISDFQKNTAQFEPDSGMNINLLPLTGVSPQNVAIDSAWFDEPVQTFGSRGILNVALHNYGSQDFENGSLRFTVNGQVKALSDFSLPAGSVKLDTLPFSVSQSGWQQAELSLTDYPVNFDDNWYLSFRVREFVPVLMINGGSSNPWLDRIYRTGSRESNLFRTETMSAASADLSAFSSYDLIVLNNIKRISSGFSAAIGDYIRQGGSVFIFPPLDADRDSYNQMLGQLGAAQLGSLVNTPRSVTKLHTEEEVFRHVFEKVPGNLALPTVNSGFELKKSNVGRGQALLSFADGSAYVGRYPAAKGQLYVCAGPLDRNVTDLPLQSSILVPMLVRIAILGDGNHPASYTIGKDEWISADAPAEGSDAIMRMKGPGGEFIPEQRMIGDRSLINISSLQTQSGIYELSRQNSNQREFLALNYDRTESDLDAFKAAQLEELFSDKGVRVLTTVSGGVAAKVGLLNDGRSLWKLCLIFALGFLAVEILLIRLL